ncbi:MAG: ribonuclease HI family protein [Deltaproteobacteria bacterium]
MTDLQINIDGASKGNPGPSGIGVVICADGRPVRNVCRFIGETTNNVAEYSALIAALEEGLVMGAKNLSIKTDSELLYRQIKKIYRVREPHIAALYEQALRLISGFASVSICHVPRELNKEADKLANKAVADHRKAAAA